MQGRQITGLILTRDEALNIGRALEALSWLDRVVIIDSDSDDETLEVARSFPNVEGFQRKFDTHATQWNYGLSRITTEWVLTLDSDYVMSPELMAEVAALQPAHDVTGYSTEFRYLILGEPLRASIYPSRVVLFRVWAGRYVDEGHTQQLRVNGRIEALSGKIDHDDRKPLGRWIQAQDKYARLEAVYLANAECGTRNAESSGGQGSEIRDQISEGGKQRLSIQDTLRKMIFVAPLIMPIYLLFGRGLILDGWRGWYYVFQRTIAELLLSLRLLESKLRE